jgi:hypothetical protein
MHPDPASGPGRRSRRWLWTLAIQAVLILLIPVILGALLGWFDLNPVEAEKLSSTGMDAHDLLENSPDSNLIVEIDYQASIGPPPRSALQTLGDRINTTTGKSSVTFEEFPFTSSQTNFSSSDLWTLETELRHTWPDWGTMSLFYLYLGGQFAEQGNVLGYAYLASSIAIFGSTIQNDSPAGEATAITTTVMVHEFGHELGLVGIVGSAPNEDPNHPHHSNDPDDVMYWAVDTSALTGLGANPPTQFDAADMSDLNTVRSTVIWSEIIPWIVLALSILVALLLVVIGIRRHRRSVSRERRSSSDRGAGSPGRSSATVVGRQGTRPAEPVNMNR